MYLSQRYMRDKTIGQKQALVLLSYIDANRLGEADLSTTVFALRNHLDNINVVYPALGQLAQFDRLFEVDEHELLVREDALRELCVALKPLS